MTRRQLAAAGLAGVALLLAGAAIGRTLVSSPSRTPAPASVPARTSPAPVIARPVPTRPPDFVEFRDKRTGYSISYPRTWRRLKPSGSQARLLVAAGSQASLLVRVTPVGLDVRGPETLPIVRTLTDSLVSVDRRVRQLAQPAALVLGGLPGYRYLYTFSSGRGGQRGAHAHFFLFSRGLMVTLVFQALPASRLASLSGLFDRIARTFTVTA